MDVYDAPEAQIVTRLREAERERDEPRARVAELEAAPGGVAVAGLLAELERERDSAKQCRALAAADGKPEIAAEYAGRHDATVRDIALIRHRLGQPTPEQKAAAEVLACDLSDMPDLAHDPCASTVEIQDWINAWFSNPDTSNAGRRAILLKCAAMGIVACDAEKGGA